MYIAAHYIIRLNTHEKILEDAKNCKHPANMYQNIRNMYIVSATKRYENLREIAFVKDDSLYYSHENVFQDL